MLAESVAVAVAVAVVVTVTAVGLALMNTTRTCSNSRSGCKVHKLLVNPSNFRHPLFQA